MKKMHICLYALFQIASAQSMSAQSVLPPETTALPDPVIVTENINDCTRDKWGYCDCNDDEYRQGF